MQCAALAEAAHSSASLISACLLHDLGHLIHSLGDDVGERGIDDRHEHRAMPFLKFLFRAEVTAPIRLHVNAKRYLCSTDTTYWDTLSPASKRSLELQGGIFSPEAANAFMQQPYAHEAVQLRRWDDQAKISGLETPHIEHFRPYLDACIRNKTHDLECFLKDLAARCFQENKTRCPRNGSKRPAPPAGALTFQIVIRQPLGSKM